VHVELFRPENVTLETEESRLRAAISKAQRLSHRPVPGREKTLVQMSRYLKKKRIGLCARKPAGVANRRLQEAEKFEEIFEHSFSAAANRTERRF